MATNQALPNLKTVVLVKDLIAAIEKTRDKEVKVEQDRAAAYPAKQAAFAVAMRAHMKMKLSQVTDAFDKSGYELADWFKRGAPDRPARPGKGCAKTKYDALLAQLRLTTDVKVKISPADFAKYMAGDENACKC